MTSLRLPESQCACDKFCLFILIAGLTLAMVWQAQFGENQLNLLARGYLLAENIKLIPYGNPMTGGGYLPGFITSLAVGLPLEFWFNYHAPELLLWVLHLFGYLIIDRVLKHFLSQHGRFYFFLLYWITPWHIYYSVQLCNPSYLYFLSAVLLWTIFEQRLKGSFFCSAVHVVALGCALELHGSALIYLFHSFLLFYFGYFRISWRGTLCGTLIIFITLLPWLGAVINNPALLPASRPGYFVGYGLIYVYPILRGILYTLKLPTFFAFAKVYRFDFRASLGSSLDTVLVPLMQMVGHFLGYVSLFVSGLAYYWFYRIGGVRNSFVATRSARSHQEWFRGLILSSHVAALTAFAFSPTGINYWDVVAMHYFAALPVALYLEQVSWFSSSWGWFFRPALRWYILLGLLVCCAVGFGSPMYRLSGRSSESLPLRNLHPMFLDLALIRDFHFKVYDNGLGWWPDVLPDSHPPPLGYQHWLGKPWQQPGWEK